MLILPNQLMYANWLKLYMVSNKPPKTWYDTLRGFFTSLGFQNFVSDSSLFYRNTKCTLLLILVYVDDILITGDDLSAISQIIHDLDNHFSLKNLVEVLLFQPVSRIILEGFADADWASHLDCRRSTSGCIFIGPSPITWSSKK